MLSGMREMAAANIQMTLKHPGIAVHADTIARILEHHPAAAHNNYYPGWERHHIMGVMEYLVIATIIIAGVWVGYHAWEESAADPYKPVEPHGAPPIQLATVHGHDPITAVAPPQGS